MSWNHIFFIIAVFAVLAVAIFLVSEIIPRRLSKQRHERNLDRLFQFDHLRTDSDAEADKPD